MHTVTINAKIGEDRTMKATARFPTSEDGRLWAKDFIEANTPLILSAEILWVEDKGLNGRFDNVLFESVADTIADRSGMDRDEVDERLRKAGEQNLWDAYAGPMIDRIQADLEIDW